MRPDATNLLPWHAEQFAHLNTLQAAGRLGHAWLIAGHQGTGKLMLALHFAHYLFCTRPIADMPCGQCSGCLLFAAGTHPDFRLLQPEKKLITIEQVRDCIEFAHNTSQRGGMKVLVFDPAEAMNLNAANALLKLLEEPPARTLLLLITHQPGLLLATLRSRCQQLRCPLPPADMAIAWLQGQNFVGNVESALHKAGGAPLRALAMADAGTLTERMVLLECLQGLLAKRLHPVEAAKKCEKFSITASIDYLLQCVADLASSKQTALPLRDAELTELAGQLGSSPGQDQSAARSRSLHAMHGSLIEARKVALASNNANPQLMLEALFVQWRQLAQAGNLRP